MIAFELRFLSRALPFVKHYLTPFPDSILFAFTFDCSSIPSKSYFMSFLCLHFIWNHSRTHSVPWLILVIFCTLSWILVIFCIMSLILAAIRIYLCDVRIYVRVYLRILTLEILIFILARVKRVLRCRMCIVRILYFSCPVLSANLDVV